jgi:hypothetical protein
MRPRTDDAMRYGMTGTQSVSHRREAAPLKSKGAVRKELVTALRAR